MKTKKLLAILLAVTMLMLSVSIPIYAEQAGQSLQILGVLKGEGSGVTQDYLAKTATRAQAALINLRLFGLEEQALAFKGEPSFIDATEATEFWQPVLGYLKANPMLGWVGYPDGSFKYDEPITGQSFTKILLVAMGYEYGLYFDWETTMTFASSLGMSALVDKADENLTMGDIAQALCEALEATVDYINHLSFISKLVADGIINKETAILAGFDIEESTLEIKKAYPSAVNEIIVQTNMEIPEDVSLTLKRGKIGIKYDLEITGDIAVITGFHKFLPGTYTVTVGDATTSFVIENQMAKNLLIEADTIYDSGVQDLKVKLVDQYGDAMSLKGVNTSVFNKTSGYVFSPTVNSTIKITTGENLAKAGDIINVFVYDPESGLTAIKEIRVIEAPYVVSIEIGDVTLGKLGGETPSRLYVGTKENKLNVKAYDQYNKEYTLTQDDIKTGTTHTNTIQILSSNSKVIHPKMAVDAKGNLLFDANTVGNTVITLIIPNQAVVTTAENITVHDTAKLTSVAIEELDKAVYASEEVAIAITGYDQYGEAIEVVSGDLDFTTTVDLDATIEIGSNNTINFTATKAGTTTLYCFCNGVFQDTLTLEVNYVAYPFQIIGVNLPDALQKGASETITDSSLVVIDQYGRKVDEPFDTTYDFAVKAITSQKSVKLTGLKLSTTHLETGTDKFEVVLTKDNIEQTHSAYTFEMKNVAAPEIDEFEMSEIAGTMYTGTTFDYGQTEADYHKTVSITATSKGTTVKLLENGDGLPQIIDIITSSNDAVVVSGSTLTANSESDTTTKLRAWTNGKEIASTVVQISNDNPKLVSIEVSDNDSKDIDWSSSESFATTAFKYFDQYGVELNGSDLIMRGELIFDSVDESKGDWDIMMETKQWWFSVIKNDGTVCETKYISIYEMFPGLE